MSSKYTKYSSSGNDIGRVLSDYDLFSDNLDIFDNDDDYEPEDLDKVIRDIDFDANDLDLDIDYDEEF